MTPVRILHLDGGSRVWLHGQGDPRELPPVPIPERGLGARPGAVPRRVRTGRPPETHLGDTLESFALLLAVIESARAGRSIRPAAL